LLQGSGIYSVTVGGDVISSDEVPVMINGTNGT
jgi:hypothetical protein